MKSRTVVTLLAASGLAGAVVYARRKRAAATPLVQLGFEDGGQQALAAGDPGVAELRSAAAALRRAFQVGS